MHEEISRLQLYFPEYSSLCELQEVGSININNTSDFINTNVVILKQERIPIFTQNPNTHSSTHKYTLAHTYQCFPCVDFVVAARHGYISAATVSEIGLYKILGRLSAVIVRVHVGE